MATTPKTTYTHTCDFCGVEHQRGELRRFGLFGIAECGGVTIVNPSAEGPLVDACEACRARPIADLADLLEVRKAERADRWTVLAGSRSAREPREVDARPASA